MKKKLLVSSLFLILGMSVDAQISELNFNHQNINFLAAPRTNINPMSIKLWDSYNNGGPTQYGTVLEIYGLSGHQTSQLNFGGWDNSRIRYREAFYAQNTWSDWITLLDSKNNLESSGNLMITGAGNHFISQGKLGLGTTSPLTALQIGNFNDGGPHNQLTIPGTYNFEQLRLGQTGNGNQTLEFVNHTGISTSYGIKFAVNVDQAAGLQIQYSPSKTSYNELSYTTGLFLNLEGNVGIGTLVPSEKLAVNGKIRAREIKVETINWPDYVFAPEQKLRSLSEVEKFIKVNNHLPEIPSAAEAEKEGINLGEMNAKLLKKIEELTLYMIEQNKASEQQAKTLSEAVSRIEELSSTVSKLSKK